jgi:3-methyladenine DNA glycosylase Tag
MALTSFKDIRKLAEERKGGKKALDVLLAAHKPVTVKKLAAISDDRYLAKMTECIFNAGFNWKVVRNKWDGFEEAFHGFNPKGLAHMSPEKWEAYVEDTRIVRNWIKIKAVLDNAHYLMEEADRHGSFGKFFAQWPASDQVGLMEYLKKNASRLGGNTCMYFIRFIGKDGFILSQDVVGRLKASGLEIKDQPTSKKDLKACQEAFNTWHEETGLPYTQLSRICGMSIGKNYSPE